MSTRPSTAGFSYALRHASGVRRTYAQIARTLDAEQAATRIVLTVAPF